MLLLGALEIHALTKEMRDKAFADSCVDELMRQQGVRKNGSYPGDCGDHGDWAAAAVASFALQFPNDPRQKAIRDSLKKYMEFCYARRQSVRDVTPRSASCRTISPVFSCFSRIGRQFLDSRSCLGGGADSSPLSRSPRPRLRG